MRDFSTEFMPHRPPMLLVDDLLESDATGGVAIVQIRPDNIFLNTAGVLSPAALVEFMAQSFAATEAYQAFLAGIIKPGGYLVGLDHIDFHQEVRIGDMLTAKVLMDGRIDRVCLVRGEVHKGEILIAAGKFRLFSF